MRWYMAFGIGYCSYVLVSNFAMKNCMDRIYYSTEHVYKRLRSEVERKKERAAKEKFQEALKKVNAVDGL